MHDQALTHRLGYILETLSAQRPISAALLDNLVGSHVYPLDPHGPAGGQTHARWRVRANLALSPEG